jgi:hypothetical protein
VDLGLQDIAWDLIEQVMQEKDMEMKLILTLNFDFEQTYIVCQLTKPVKTVRIHDSEI